MNVLLGAQPMLGAGRMMRPVAGFLGIGPIQLLAFMAVGALIVGVILWALFHKPKTDAAYTPATLAPAADTAIAIARERLARGEIEPDQYVAIVTALAERASVAAQPDASPLAG